MKHWIREHTSPVIALSAVALAVIAAAVTVVLVNRANSTPWTPDRYVSYVRESGGPTPDEVSDDAIATAGQGLCSDLDSGITAERLTAMVTAGTQLPNGGYVGLSDESMGGNPLPVMPGVAERLVAGAVRTYCPGHESELRDMPDVT